MRKPRVIINAIKMLMFFANVTVAHSLVFLIPGHHHSKNILVIGLSVIFIFIHFLEKSKLAVVTHVTAFLVVGASLGSADEEFLIVANSAFVLLKLISVVRLLRSKLGLNKSIDVPGKKFYSSKAWRELRYKILVKHGKKCAACGTTDKNMEYHVDHIKPRSLYPHLALDPKNLRVCCKDCNLGRSNHWTIDNNGNEIPSRAQKAA